jgi:hypothetical protein
LNKNRLLETVFSKQKKLSIRREAKFSVTYFEVLLATDLELAHSAGLCELFRRSPGRNPNQKLLRDQVRGHSTLV